MDRIAKQGHTTFSPINSRWAVIYIPPKNRFLFSCINQIYDIIAPTTEYLKQSFLFTCQCLADDKHAGHVKLASLLSETSYEEESIWHLCTKTSLQALTIFRISATSLFFVESIPLHFTSTNIWRDEVLLVTEKYPIPSTREIGVCCYNPMKVHNLWK